MRGIVESELVDEDEDDEEESASSLPLLLLLLLFARPVPLLEPPLDLVVRTKWPDAIVDWGDTEPIL